MKMRYKKTGVELQNQQYICIPTFDLGYWEIDVLKPYNCEEVDYSEELDDWSSFDC